MLKNKLSICLDYFLNILASLVLTVASQLIAYPMLSRWMSTEEYGMMLILMGVINAVAVSLGNPLNNTRLLVQSVYDKGKEKGDFNNIFIGLIFLNIFFISLFSYLIIGKLSFKFVFYSLISFLVMFRSYYSVEFRLIINYMKMLKTSIASFIGYLCGLFLSKMTGEWAWTFILGELFGCLYIIMNSTLLKEGINKSSLFKMTFNKFIMIFLSSIIVAVSTYLDRFFIYPVLGSENVAIYNVASFFGKTAGIIMTPITGVMLTYYAKEHDQGLKTFYIRLMAFVLFSILFYIASIVIGNPIISLLYPDYINDAYRYMNLANLSAILFILSNTIQPTLLRYCKSFWQPIIQGIYILMYIIFGYIGMINNGLLGFCCSMILTNIFKIIFMICIVHNTLSKQKK